MSNLISKTLSNFVLGEEFDSFEQYNQDMIMDDSFPISRNDLSSRCKEWAIGFNYFIETRYVKDFEKWRCILNFDLGGTEYQEVECIPLADTEALCVIEACEWLVDNDKVKV